MHNYSKLQESQDTRTTQKAKRFYQHNNNKSSSSKKQKNNNKNNNKIPSKFPQKHSNETALVNLNPNMGQ
jgi:hypothetical protein